MSIDMNYKREVRSYIVKNFLFGESGSLQDDTSFLESGTIDSTGVLELIAFLESTYQVKVQNEEMLPDNLDSIAKVSAFVEKKRAAASAAQAKAA
jgi:acyl carrier protein